MILGIDPGVLGGLAVLDGAGGVWKTVSFDGLTESDLAFEMADAAPRCNRRCIIEKVGYIKGDGPMGAFTFGKIYGLLRGMALGFGLEITDVYPMMWQSAFSCLSMGNKNVTKNTAIALFPAYHKARPRGITHGVADALLIAEYGRRRGMR